MNTSLNIPMIIYISLVHLGAIYGVGIIQGDTRISQTLQIISSKEERERLLRIGEDAAFEFLKTKKI